MNADLIAINYGLNEGMELIILDFRCVVSKKEGLEILDKVKLGQVVVEVR